MPIAYTVWLDVTTFTHFYFQMAHRQGHGRIRCDGGAWIYLYIYIS